MKTTEEYEEEFHKVSNRAVCRSCGEFKYQPEDIWFNEQGCGYSTKLTKCPHCGRVVIVKVIEDYGFSKINTDKRYFY